MLTAFFSLDSYNSPDAAWQLPISASVVQNSNDESGFDDEDEIIEEETIAPVEEFDDEDFDDDFDDDFEEDAEELEDDYDSGDDVAETDDDVEEDLDDDDF